MRCLITGAAGFLGSHLADHLLAEGHEVRGIDNMSTGDARNLPAGLSEFWNQTIEAPDMDALFRGVDVVYHCAAAAYEGASVFSPAFISRNIYAGSANVFMHAVRNGVRRVVFTSSMARYGAIMPPFREVDVCRPVDPYGIAKEAAERLLVSLSQAHGIEYAIAVPHNIYGPRQRYIDPYRNVAAIMANLMLQGRAPYIYGDGKQARSFSYVDDVVPYLAAMGTEALLAGYTINLGPGSAGAIYIRTLYEHLADIVGFKGGAAYLPSRPLEVHQAFCSQAEAYLLWGFKPKVPLLDGLERLVAFIRARGPAPFEYTMPLEIQSANTPKTWTEHLL